MYTAKKEKRVSQYKIVEVCSLINENFKVVLANGPILSLEQVFTFLIPRDGFWLQVACQFWRLHSVKIYFSISCIRRPVRTFCKQLFLGQIVIKILLVDIKSILRMQNQNNLTCIHECGPVDRFKKNCSNWQIIVPRTFADKRYLITLIFPWKIF